MTLGDWLAARTPPPPPALSDRLQTLIGEDLTTPADEAPERLLAAAERLLQTMIDPPASSRDAALDLLAADALVTYAFEAAGDDPSRLEERARAAMNRVAGFVPEESGR